MKAEQILKINPDNELTFKGPFTSVVTCPLTLQNPANDDVCFKIKTTAPKQYCVRPNSGVIAAGGIANISIMLQPFDYNPNDRQKHKFMVQSVYLKGETPENIWHNLDPNRVMDSKLRCVFDMPTATASSAGDSLQANSTDLQSATSSVGAGVLTDHMSMASSDTNATKLSDRGGDAPDRLREDHNRLSIEVNNLMNENAKLKDEATRLRKLALQESVTSSLPPPDAKQLHSTQLPLYYWALLVLALLLGLIMGRFV